MHILFLTILILVLAYILLGKRSFDFFSVAILSGLFYFMPAILGYAYNPYLNQLEPLAISQYYIITVYYVSFFIGALIKDHYYKSPTSHAKSNQLFYSPLNDTETKYAHIASLSLAIIFGLAFIYIFISLGHSAFILPKSVLLAHLGVMFSILCSCCLIGIIYWYQRSWLLFSLNIIGILYVLIVGYRFLFILSFLILAILYLSRQGIQSLLINNRVLVIIGGILGFLLLNNGAISAFVEQKKIVFSEKNVKAALIRAEPMVIQENLNLVLKNEYRIPADYIYHNLGIAFIPFSSKLGYQAKSFNAFIQPKFYKNYPYGVANNIWAEMYALGGFPLLYGFMEFLVILCFIFSIKLNKCSQNTQALIIPLCAILFFYIHRNDLTYTINLVRNLILVWSFINVTAILLVKFIPNKIKKIGV